MKCVSCENLHDGTFGSGRFCSLSCANKRDRSDEFKKNLSEIMSGRTCGPSPFKGKERVSRIERSCNECGVIFLCTEKSERKYCSRECGSKHIGGYREKSGRAKSGYYKGIYCGSTYELCWVIYNLDHSKEFKRFDSCLEYNGKKYFPDFIQDGMIIEIKGYESQEKVEVKNNIAIQNGYEVRVLRKEDLQQEFEWVRNNYTDDFKTLYDDYKPRYNYYCSHCSIEFGKDKKSKYEKVFCSRECSLKGNRKVSGKNQYTKRRDAAGVATSPSN